MEKNNIKQNAMIRERWKGIPMNWQKKNEQRILKAPHYVARCEHEIYRDENEM